jgi:hypothetical protein
MLIRSVFFITLIYLSFASQSFASDYVKVADLPNEKIFLYAKQIDHQGIYKGIKLNTNNQTYNFPKWISTTNPAYGPVMKLRDFDSDGKAEIDIILSNGKKPLRHILKFLNGNLVEI